MTKTTILIESETRDKLRHIGRKMETYDDILNKLIRMYERHEREKRLANDD